MLRSFMMGSGVQCVTLTGVSWMQLSCAASWGCQVLVVSLACTGEITVDSM